MLKNPLNQLQLRFIREASNLLTPQSELMPTQSNEMGTLKGGGVDADGNIYKCGILGVTPLGDFRLCNRGY